MRTAVIGPRPAPSRAEATQRVSITDRLLCFRNRIAARVTAKAPDLLFGMAAYIQYTRAPVREKGPPEPRPDDWPHRLQPVPGDRFSKRGLGRKGGGAQATYRPSTGQDALCPPSLDGRSEVGDRFSKRGLGRKGGGAQATYRPSTGQDALCPPSLDGRSEVIPSKGAPRPPRLALERVRSADRPSSRRSTPARVAAGRAAPRRPRRRSGPALEPAAAPRSPSPGARGCAARADAP